MGGGKKDSKLMQNTDLFFFSFIYLELWDKLFHAEEI